MNAGDDGLLLVGVGGGGCRFASIAANRFGPGVHAIGFDSDAMTARSTKGMRCMLLGVARYDGRGTGGDAVKGRTAVMDDEQAVADAAAKARLAVVVTALGGGFGSGATPEILRILRGRGVTTLCLATTPFSFEGKDREARATRSIPLLEEGTDALAVLRMDDLYGETADKTRPLAEAAPAAAARLGDAIMLVWSLLLTPGFIGLGQADLLGIVRQSGGRCRFAVADASGEARAAEGVGKLCRSPMLGGAPLSDARMAVLGVLAGPDLRLAELGEISETFRLATARNCVFRLGTVLDERYAGALKLVGLFFDAAGPARDAPDAVPAEIPLDDLPPRGRGRARPRGDSRLAAGATGLERFKGADGTFMGGEDLDSPAYLRRGLKLDR